MYNDIIKSAVIPIRIDNYVSIIENEKNEQEVLNFDDIDIICKITQSRTPKELAKGLIFPNGSILYGQSYQLINVPLNYIGVIYSNSKSALLGLNLVNYILHPGYYGHPSLVLQNLSGKNLEIPPYAHVGDIVLYSLSMFDQKEEQIIYSGNILLYEHINMLNMNRNGELK